MKRGRFEWRESQLHGAGPGAPSPRRASKKVALHGDALLLRVIGQLRPRFLLRERGSDAALDDLDKLFCATWVDGGRTVLAGSKCGRLVKFSPFDTVPAVPERARARSGSSCGSARGGASLREQLCGPVVAAPPEWVALPRSSAPSVCVDEGGGIHAVRASPGRRLAATAGAGGCAERLALLELPSLAALCLSPEGGHTDWAFGLSWLAEHVLASCSRDGSVMLWNVRAATQGLGPGHGLQLECGARVPAAHVADASSEGRPPSVRDCCAFALGAVATPARELVSVAPSAKVGQRIKVWQLAEGRLAELAVYDRAAGLLAEPQAAVARDQGPCVRTHDTDPNLFMVAFANRVCVLDRRLAGGCPAVLMPTPPSAERRMQRGDVNPAQAIRIERRGPGALASDSSEDEAVPLEVDADDSGDGDDSGDQDEDQDTAQPQQHQQQQQQQRQQQTQHEETRGLLDQDHPGQVQVVQTPPPPLGRRVIDALVGRAMVAEQRGAADPMRSLVMRGSIVTCGAANGHLVFFDARSPAAPVKREYSLSDGKAGACVFATEWDDDGAAVFCAGGHLLTTVREPFAAILH
jgi:hypothetical protein